MARDHARLLTRIWADDDFRNMSEAGQRFYMLALSTPGTTYAGVVSYTVGRWATLARDSNPRKLRKAAAEAQAARFVVIDEGTEELFIRSHLRNDRILRQPNVAIAACRAYRDIVSPMVRASWLVELHRLAEDDTFVSELVGGAVMTNKAADAVIELYTEPLPEGFPEGFPKGLYQGLAEGFWERFTDALPEPSAYTRAAPTPSPRAFTYAPTSGPSDDPLSPICEVHRDHREPCAACEADRRYLAGRTA